MTEEGAYVFLINGNVARAGSARPQLTELDNPDMEGGCFAGNGFLVSTESRELLLFKDPAFRVR